MSDMSQTAQPVQPRIQSRTQKLTGIALFTALAIILNISFFKVNAPFLNFVQYELWEIPIVAVLLIYGVSAALTVSVVNTVVLLLYNQGALPTGPLYNLAAVLVMLGAIIFTHRSAVRVGLDPKFIVILATASGIIVRSAVMMLFNYVLLPFPPPVGFSDPAKFVIPILPLIAFFNATLALYTIPIAYFVVREVSKRFRFKLAFPLEKPRMKA
jgi:riboflavin transporter FmnP